MKRTSCCANRGIIHPLYFCSKKEVEAILIFVLTAIFLGVFFYRKEEIDINGSGNPSLLDENF